MNSHFKIKVAFSLLLMGILHQAIASDFSMPFVSGSELGNAYAGVAASANDASTSYTNPAGLVKLTSKQLVVSAIGVHGNVQFHGTTTTPAFSQTGTTNGTIGGFIPLFYYSQPLTKNIVFGFGENVPFALGSNYDKTSAVRYSGTHNQIVVIDLGPSLAVKISDQLSLGFGLDIEQLNLTLQNMTGPPFAIPDAENHNYVQGWGYGFHAGVLDQLTTKTRVGMTFHSQIMFHAKGYSQIFSSTSGNFRVPQRTSTALPAVTQLSVYHDVNPCLAAMATVTYTNWSTLNQVTLQNSVLPGGGVTPVTIPFEYHNTFDYALGLNFKANDKWLLRTGLQYFNAPSNNRNRSVINPFGAALMVGIGAHYQQNACFGYDVSYAHNFTQTTTIHTVTPFSSAIGHEWLSPNILGVQLTWNI